MLTLLRICLAPVKFTLRNYSLTHPSRYVIKFGAKSEEESDQSQVFPCNSATHLAYPPCSDLLPPRYAGRLTIRGGLRPTQSTTLETRLWVARPGAYALTGWQVETIVGEPGSDYEQSPWRTRHRYVQGPPLDHHPRMIVTDVSR